MLNCYLQEVRKDTLLHSLGKLSLNNHSYYVDMAVIIAIILLPFRKSECSRKSLFLGAVAPSVGTMQRVRSWEEGETSLMFTLACHASFLLLCHGRVCQALFWHNVSIHHGLRRQSAAARAEVSVRALSWTLRMKGQRNTNKTSWSCVHTCV